MITCVATVTVHGSSEGTVQPGNKHRSCHNLVLRQRKYAPGSVCQFLSGLRLKNGGTVTEPWLEAVLTYKGQSTRAVIQPRTKMTDDTTTPRTCSQTEDEALGPVGGILIKTHTDSSIMGSSSEDPSAVVVVAVMQNTTEALVAVRTDDVCEPAQNAWAGDSQDGAVSGPGKTLEITTTSLQFEMQYSTETVVQKYADDPVKDSAGEDVGANTPEYSLDEDDDEDDDIESLLAMV